MELNQYGFSKVRTEQIRRAIYDYLKAYFTYAEEITLTNNETIRIEFRQLLSVRREKSSVLYIAVNKTSPIKENKFVPIYHTAQISMEYSKGEVEGLPIDDIVYPYIHDKRPYATSVVSDMYNLGLFYDEGGEPNLEKIAKQVYCNLSAIMEEYFEFADKNINEFKTSCGYYHQCGNYLG